MFVCSFECVHVTSMPHIHDSSHSWGTGQEAICVKAESLYGLAFTTHADSLAAQTHHLWSFSSQRLLELDSCSDQQICFQTAWSDEETTPGGSSVKASLFTYRLCVLLLATIDFLCLWPAWERASKEETFSRDREAPVLHLPTCCCSIINAIYPSSSRRNNKRWLSHYQTIVMILKFV